MKLRVLSDLHTEFDNQSTRFVPQETDDADVVVLAGDIGSHTHGIEWSVNQQAFAGKPIIHVLGNHEFYDAEYWGILKQCRLRVEQYREQGVEIYLLENDVAVVDGVRFLGAIWTDYALYGQEHMHWAMHEARRGMNDHRLIRYSDRGTTMDNYSLKDAFFLPEHAQRLHRRSKAFLAAELAKPFDGKTVVITHHLPSRQCVATRFENDIISACFASQLEDLVEKADVWICGHTHDTFDFQLGRCRVVCNPRGYPSEENTNGFRPNLIVEV